MPYTARVIDSLHHSSSPECRSIFDDFKSVNCDELSSLEKVLSDDTDLTFEELDLNTSTVLRPCGNCFSLDPLLRL